LDLEYVREGVGVSVISTPTGSIQLVVQLRLGVVKDFSLDLTQLDHHAQFIAAHLLQLDRYLCLHLRPSACPGIEGELEMGKTLPSREACFRKKFPGRPRIKWRPGWRLVICHSGRNKMESSLFAAEGELPHDPFAIGSQRQRGAD